MAITPISDPPLRSQGLTQAEYSAQFEAFMTSLPLAVDDFNAAASAFQLAVTGTSTSSVTIGTGSKSFTTQTGLGFVVGMTLRLAFDSTNYMTGDVTSYNTGTGALVVNVTAVVGSGTRATWTISLAAVGANTAGAVSFTPAGNIAATNVQAAIQELDTEKLSSAAGAVTGTNLEDITTAETVGSTYVIPVITKDVNGRVTTITTAQKLLQGTINNSTGVTSKDFTSISSSAKRISVCFSGSSLSGTSSYLIQIGNTTFTTSGYTSTSNQFNNSSTSSGVSSTAGFVISVGAAANVFSGVLTLTNITGDIWVSSHNGKLSSTNVVSGGGDISLGAILDRVRVTTVNGTDTFDAGSVNILVE